MTLDKLSIPSSHRRQLLMALAGAAGHALWPAAARAATSSDPFQPQLGRLGKDVIWLPTPDRLINLLLRIAQAGPEDKLVDLGSGDGRFVIAAARDFSTPSLGVEFDPAMVSYSERKAQEAGVSQRARFVQGDIFKTDFSDATVVFMYLLPQINVQLRHTLMAMKPGTRILTHQFHLGKWQADAVIDAEHRKGYFWVVPANAGGHWRLQLPADVGLPSELHLTQTFQKLAGRTERQGAGSSVLDPRLYGRQLHFTLADQDGQRLPLSATLDGDRMSGHLDTARGPLPFSGQRVGAAPPIAGAEPADDAELAAAAASLEQGL